MHRAHWRLAATLTVLVAACRPSFQLKHYPTTDGLYQAGLKEFQRHHWENAISAFEKLTVELPARDTLLPRSYWYLATAHERHGEHLLAAQSYSRLTESFPEDSLADDAALAGARAYRKLWRKPELDDTYGQTALAAYQTLVTLYPSSPLLPAAEKEMAQLNDWFAQKNFVAGMFYLRRKAYDSAIIYFKDVLRLYPSTSQARRSLLQLHEAYTRIHYRDDAAEACATALQTYPDDREVRETCHTQAAVTPPRPTPPLIVPNDSVAAHGDSATGRPPR